MKLKEYAKLIATLAEKYPNAKVIYSRDDEGNGFEEVHYAPSLGDFDSENGEFESDGENKKVNAVCVN